MTPSDEELMERCQQGDRQAFGVLYERYQSPVLRFTRRLLNGAPMAEDLAQETFLKVLQAAPSFWPGARFKPWLYKIATNLCLNEVRRTKRQNVLSLNETLTLEITDQDQELLELHELLPDEASLPPDLAVLQAESHARVRRALTYLSPAHQEVIELRFYEDLPYEAISERLSCSLGTAKSRIHYALRRLRELLKQEEEG